MSTITENPTDLSNEQLIDAYRMMLNIRRVEERVGMAYQMKKFSGFCHLYIGQEAVAVAGCAAMRPEDHYIVAYRDHGQAMAKGVSAEAVVAELFGRKTGSTGGKGGSMHIFDASKRFYGGWGIVGGQVPLAAGIAFGIKYKELPEVCVCSMGEGSIHQGVFHEALNMAALWELPVVFVCENNKYAMGTEMSRISAVSDLTLKAVGYGMASATVDGQDFFACYQGMKEAIDRARNESRPTFLDVKTYRFRGHSMSDPGSYRSKEEVQQEMERDPILKLGEALLSLGAIDQAGLDAIDAEARALAKEALAAAEAAPWPDDEAAFDHVYVKPMEPIEGR
jgi:pyruvate dehydrogenase E1 component alpha subunit